MPLIDQVSQDMVAAMKAREEARLSALRMIKAALMKLKVDSPKPLDEAAEMQVLKSLIKQRIDAAEMFRKAGRAEQADKEEAERTLIESYLPAGASEEETDAAIAEAMAETGVAGTACCAWFLGLLLYLSLRDLLQRDKPFAAALHLSGLVACVGFLVHSLVDFNLHIPANALLFLLMAHLATGEIRPSPQENHRPHIRTRNPH